MQKIEGNPLEKEEERKSCMFIYFLCIHALIRVSFKIFLLDPPFEKFLDPRLLTMVSINKFFRDVLLHC